MARGHDAEAITAAASRLFASGEVGDAQLRAAAHVGGALPVRAPDGSLQSWFVPIIVGDHLAAFLQILPDGALMRFSSFEDRPQAADWLDAGRIGRRAENARRADETMGEPHLTYDRNPDRLVWSVPFINAGGVTRQVYVAGTQVFTPPPSGGIG